MKSFEVNFREKQGQLLKQYRQKKNMTHEQLAEKAGLDANNIGRIERGERAPSNMTFHKLLYALDIYPESEVFNELEKLLKNDESLS